MDNKILSNTFGDVWNSTCIVSGDHLNFDARGQLVTVEFHIKLHTFVQLVTLSSARTTEGA